MRQPLNGGDDTFGRMVDLEVAAETAREYGRRTIAAIATARILTTRGYSPRAVTTWRDVAAITARMACVAARKAGVQF
jgi:hypothetical protein